MFRKCTVALFGLLLLLPGSGFAWGVLGHRAVARIAENHLTPRARQEVARLLGTETLPLVSTWPDEIRSDPQYKDTGPWHYLNVASGLDFSGFVAQLTATTTTTTTAATPPTDAYTALRQVRKDLKDPTKTAAEKLFALKFLVHLVGDGDGPAVPVAPGVGHCQLKNAA